MVLIEEVVFIIVNFVISNHLRTLWNGGAWHILHHTRVFDFRIVVLRLLAETVAVFLLRIHHKNATFISCRQRFGISWGWWLQLGHWRWADHTSRLRSWSLLMREGVDKIADLVSHLAGSCFRVLLAVIFTRSPATSTSRSLLLSWLHWGRLFVKALISVARRFPTDRRSMLLWVSGGSLNWISDISRLSFAPFVNVRLCFVHFVLFRSYIGAIILRGTAKLTVVLLRVSLVIVN